ncbi:hypothetical protein DITRI_Ditri15bG0057800 [Diplodiscus trichospermus]
MNDMEKLLILLTTCFFLYFLIALLKVLYEYWWIPLRIQNILRSQGVKGPPYRFIHGNNKEVTKLIKEPLSKPMAFTHDIFPRAMPHVYSWINRYEPEIVIEVLKNSEKAFPKRKPPIYNRRLLGDGLILAEGEKWVKQRKLANYAFHGESLKNMTPEVIASVETMLEKWKGQEGKEMEVFKEFRLLTSEVISRTAFGSSYLEGEKIFDLLLNLSTILAVIGLRLGFLSSEQDQEQEYAMTGITNAINKLWKSADDIESEKLEKEIQESVMEIVKKREDKVKSGEADNLGSDFLGLLLNAYNDVDEKNKISLDDLVDEWKTFYFAGQETTNSLLAWTVLLLAVHRDWQEKARREVIEIFGNQNPNSECIAKLKTVTMVVNETLRLYPPVNITTRRAERAV